MEAAVFIMRKRILWSWGRRGRVRQQSRHHNQGAGFWNRGLSWRRWLFSSTPVLHTHRARQPHSCAWLSPGNGGGALTPDHFPPLREESHMPSSHPGELTAPLPTSAFLSRGDVRISNLRRGALAHLRGGLMPGPGADSSLGQDASPNHGPGPPCLNCLQAPSGGGCGLALRFLKSRQILRAQESREDYDCRPPPITSSSCPGPRRISSQCVRMSSSQPH